MRIYRRLTFLILSLLAMLGRAAESAETSTGAAPAVATSKARVLIVQATNATTAFQANPGVVRDLVNSGLVRFTEKRNLKSAWLSLVKTNDIVGLKIFSNPGANSGTRPAVVAALIEGLLDSGLPSTNIVIWDKHETDLRRAGYFELARKYGVRVQSAATVGYDGNEAYENPIIGSLVWGDHEFGKKGPGVGRKSFVSLLITTNLTKIICVSPLLNHNVMGITGCLASVALGSVDNTLRFEGDIDRLSTAVPEIYALQSVGDRVVLNITDALICQYEGEQQSLLHYSTSLNQIWISRDPVALDVLGIQELNRQRDVAHLPSPKSPQLLYQNAAILELGASDLRSVKIDFVSRDESVSMPAPAPPPNERTSP